MALIECVECAAQISDKATACVRCGAPVVVEVPPIACIGGKKTSGPCPNCKKFQTTGCEKCDGCGASLSGDSWELPAVEKPITRPFDANVGGPISEQSSSSWWKWVLGIPIGLFAIFVAFGFLVGANDPQSNAKSRGRAAIKLCWDEQSRKSLDSSTQSFIAGACEKMERDFRTTYNSSP